MQFWIEIGKLVAGIATPIVVAVIGVMLLRRVEGIKAFIVKQSDFQQKWAEEFFACGQEFMQALERELALLTALTGLTGPNGKFGTELQHEASQLHITLSELGLRIRRSVVFAPYTAEIVTQAANDCLSLTAQLLASKKGNVDVIINKMNQFNAASRKAHAEMLD